MGVRLVLNLREAYYLPWTNVLDRDSAELDLVSRLRVLPRTSASFDWRTVPTRSPVHDKRGAYQTGRSPERSLTPVMARLREVEMMEGESQFSE